MTCLMDGCELTLDRWRPHCRRIPRQVCVLRGELELCRANPRGTRFQNQAASLNVSAESLYNALIADAENAPPNFDLQGRQVDAWKQYRTSHLLPARHFFLF